MSDAQKPPEETLAAHPGASTPQDKQMEGAEIGAKGESPTGSGAPTGTGPAPQGQAPSEAQAAERVPSGAQAAEKETGASPPGGPQGADEAGEVAAEEGQPNLHGCPVTETLGQRTVHTDRGRYLALMEALYADGYEMCVSVTGVDYLTHPGRALPPDVRAERFEVVAELVSLSSRQRLRVRCQVPEADPVVPSLFDLWPGTEAHERETFDMFGIRFQDHPDLTRILMPEDWEGHPLRKDYATGHVPVQFKEAPK